MKIAVLLSGGVDSSVALRLLADQGHDITAFYLKIWLEDERAFLGDCPWETDLGFARAVCADLDVPLQIIPLQAEYLDQVVSYALAELQAGRTPSPDIFCNQRIKFGAFYDRIDAAYDKVASGHYARIEQKGDRFLLKRAPDPVKDQTYFLSHLSQAQLARALFPIGHLRKAQVRQLATRHGLATQDRKDSQGICFLGKISYRDFVSSHLGQRPGDIRERESGRLLGPHQGYWFYTIGQRQGLGLSGGPWYVVGKDTQANIVYVSHKEHFANHTRHQFTVARLNWIAGPPDRPDVQVKLRHGPQLGNCRVDIITGLLQKSGEGKMVHNLCDLPFSIRCLLNGPGQRLAQDLFG
ncbi:MAG: tRNA 2-thiouridine(34) synthase MnmA, partial [Candidatus Latescibacteria bacterium]|nr:tRNA 2-thiouridine(34) synthase MnmA [Candidatus Latescibacterota bacterium]